MKLSSISPLVLACGAAVARSCHAGTMAELTHPEAATWKLFRAPAGCLTTRHASSRMLPTVITSCLFSRITATISGNRPELLLFWSTASTALSHSWPILCRPRSTRPLTVTSLQRQSLNNTVGKEFLFKIYAMSMLALCATEQSRADAEKRSQTDLYTRTVGVRTLCSYMT